MTTQIERDPFARATLIRETIPKQFRGSCKWCGQPAKFRYSWEPDGVHVRVRFMNEEFCSVSCYRAYAS